MMLRQSNRLSKHIPGVRRVSVVAALLLTSIAPIEAGVRKDAVAASSPAGMAHLTSGCTSVPGAPDSLLARFHGACWVWTMSHQGTDWITRVRELRDGSIVAVGFVNRDAQLPDGWQAFAARLTAGGEPLWTRTYGGAGIDAFWDARDLGNGEIVVAGFTDDGNSGWVAWIDNESGALLRERRLNEKGASRLLGVALSADGESIRVTGEVVPPGRGTRDAYIASLKRDGSVRWERTFGDSASTDRAFYVEEYSGGLVLAGVTAEPGAYDLLTMRLDSDGNLLWKRVHGGPGNDPNHGLAVRPDGRIVVAGYTNSGDIEGAHDIVALVYDGAGVLEQESRFRAPGDDRVMGIAADGSGGVWYAGYTTSYTAGDWDLFVARLTPDNQFERFTTMGGRADDNAYAIALADNGDLLLGGYSTGPSGGTQPADLLVLRVNPAQLTR